TQEAIQNAPVEMTVADREPLKLQTNGQGKFTGKVPEMLRYSIAASSAGFIPQSQQYTLPELLADTTIFIEILLQPVAKELIVSGNVYDKKTDALIPAKVMLTLKDTGDKPFMINASKGSYEKQIDKKGWYMITAT